jgi:hypothetical protein
MQQLDELRSVFVAAIIGVTICKTGTPMQEEESTTLDNEKETQQVASIMEPKENSSIANLIGFHLYSVKEPVNHKMATSII